MSKLDELITELCSDGVDYKKIKEVASVTAGNSAPQKQEFFVNGKHPFCRTADVGKARKSVDFNSITDKLNDDGIRGLRLFPKGSILIPKSGASTLLNNRVRLSIDSYVVSHLAVIIPNEQIINSKFLYYAIEGFDMGTLVEDISYPSVKSSKIADSIVIPLPPLPVQREIVRILDNFTELTVELTAELTARKKQYEYYKNSLLTFNESVQRIALGNICLVQSGGTPSKAKHEYWDNGTIKWLGSTVCQNQKTVTEVTNYISETGLRNSSAKLMKKDTTLIALVGATIGKIAFLPFEATVNQNIAGVYPVDLSKLDPSYLFYACGMLYDNFVGLTQGKLAMANLSFVRGLKIPVPTLEEQERIVSILDNFDALVNDISSGIPGEIEARRKQYEYYRDKLLSFEQAKA